MCNVYKNINVVRYNFNMPFLCQKRGHIYTIIVKKQPIVFCSLT